MLQMGLCAIQTRLSNGTAQIGAFERKQQDQQSSWPPHSPLQAFILNSTTPKEASFYHHLHFTGKDWI